MDINQNTRFTNVSYSPWNLEKTDPDQQQHNMLQDQIPMMHSVWPSNYPFHQLHQIPSSSSSPSASSPSSNLIPSSGFLNDILGIQLLEEDEEPEEELGAMKEMMYKIAAMQPVDIDPATIRKPKRRNVRISDDPQSVAARHRRERISEKIRILQRLVPGGTKMDTASMLDEAIRYVKFLKRQIRLLQASPSPNPQGNISTTTVGVNNSTTSGSLPSGIEWSFAPSIVSRGSTTFSSMDTLAGLGFNPPGGHNGDGSGGFNHEVISD